jgi:hypothetical protein
MEKTSWDREEWRCALREAKPRSATCCLKVKLEILLKQKQNIRDKPE